MTEFEQRIADLSAASVTGDPAAFLREGEALHEDLQVALKRNPDQRKELGSLIGALRKVLSQVKAMEFVDWVKIGGGYFAIGHRPGKKLVGDLKKQGCTHVVTLLAESEGALQVKSIVDAVGMYWDWFPMDSAKQLDPDRLHTLRAVFAEWQSNLDKGGQYYLHCSAGIHRTGYITFAFLLYLGLGEPKALNVLRQLRLETVEGVGDQRLAWARAMAGGV